jgi:hypothetical protein
MKQFIKLKSIMRSIVVLFVGLIVLTTFTGFKKSPVYSSNHFRNGYPVVYMVYITGAQTLPSSYNTPIYEIECVGAGRLCAIYVEDLDLDTSISISELIHFMSEYDTNANGSLHDEAYVPGVLIKKSIE